MKINKLSFLIALAFLAITPALNAGLIFTLDQDGCTGGCGTPPYGTVTLNQGMDANTVDVLVELEPAFAFVNTGGPHHSLVWNLSGSPAITISNLTAGFSQNVTNTTGSPFGTFGYAIDCDVCGNGASNTQPGPLSFSVSAAGGLTPSSFIGNTPGGYYFAADILGTTGNTGNVAAKGPGTDTPEPASVTLVGAGLLAAGVLLKRR